MKTFSKLLMAFGFFFFAASVAEAGITFSPYYSVRSTKSVSPNRSAGTETEKISQFEEKGLKAGIKFWRLFGASLSVGQGYRETTTQDQEIVDEYGEIDFSSDLDSSTTGKTTLMKETQNKVRATLMFDPGFWIFIARLKAGVTATQRIVKVYEDEEQVLHEEPEPTYNPHAGVGFGVRFSPRIYAMAEYSFFFYKFPETEPFERELSVSFGFSM